MRASVVVPTWRRPEDLGRCLAGLAAQKRLPDEIVIVVRQDDTLTWRFLEQEAPARVPALRTVNLSTPGLIAGVNAGLDAFEGDLVAFTDDDAVPRPDWLERIEAHMSDDPRVGAVGGRDWVHDGEGSNDGASRTVGKVRWYGRVVGNHHLGVGAPRRVDTLKGVNMAFRGAAVSNLRIRPGLRGKGAQVHGELDLSLAVRNAGWKLVYDPAVAVDHYPAQRFDEDQRVGRSLGALANQVYNQTLVLLGRAPRWQRPVVLVYGLLVGSRQAPGLVLALERTLRRRRISGAFGASTRARVEAARDLVKDARLD
jgi:GT2 family glycosyltransferase